MRALILSVLLLTVPHSAALSQKSIRYKDIEGTWISFPSEPDAPTCNVEEGDIGIEIKKSTIIGYEHSCSVKKAIINSKNTIVVNAECTVEGDVSLRKYFFSRHGELLLITEEEKFITGSERNKTTTQKYVMKRAVCPSNSKR